jgi:hypothetical protein
MYSIIMRVKRANLVQSAMRLLQTRKEEKNIVCAIFSFLNAYVRIALDFLQAYVNPNVLDLLFAVEEEEVSSKVEKKNLDTILEVLSHYLTRENDGIVELIMQFTWSVYSNDAIRKSAVFFAEHGSLFTQFILKLKEDEFTMPILQLILAYLKYSAADVFETFVNDGKLFLLLLLMKCSSSYFRFIHSLGGMELLLSITSTDGLVITQKWYCLTYLINKKSVRDKLYSIIMKHSFYSGSGIKIGMFFSAIISPLLIEIDEASYAKIIRCLSVPREIESNLLIGIEEILSNTNNEVVFRYIHFVPQFS